MLGLFEAKYQNCMIDECGDYILSFKADKREKINIRKLTEQIKSGSAEGKERLKIEIDYYKEKRSLSANAYFHVLVDKIAKSMNMGTDACKHKMNLEYGAIMLDSQGAKVGIKLPKSVNVSHINPYAKWFDERTENGKQFNCYIIYKPTHTLDSKEMARLIDGVVLEAQELGIETKSPEELNLMIKRWEANNE